MNLPKIPALILFLPLLCPQAHALEIESIEVTNESAAVRFQADTNWVYKLQFCPALTGTWYTVSDEHIFPSEPASFSSASTNSAGYFRLKGIPAVTLASNRLAQIKSSIDAYKAWYGQYPPVASVEYEYENVSNQPPFMRLMWLTDPNNYGKNPPKLFEYGLVSYLWPRARSSIEHTNSLQWIPDTTNDLAAKASWASYLADIPIGTNDVEYNIFEPGISCSYTNNSGTIMDPWGKEIHYQSGPPYLTNRLWSSGPDRTSGNSDDIEFVSF